MSVSFKHRGSEWCGLLSRREGWPTLAFGHICPKTMRELLLVRQNKPAGHPIAEAAVGLLHRYIAEEREPRGSARLYSDRM